MKRIWLIILTLTILLVPLAADAQQPARVPRVGVLVALAPPPAPQQDLDAFRQGLRELGYVEGRTVLLELRWNEGRPERWPELVSELIRVPVDVIVVQTTGSALAARQATRTIPIVSASSGMLVEEGVVQSLARPGGNVTGLTGVTAEVSAKRVELLKEVVPKLARVAVLVRSYGLWPSLGERLVKETETGARALGIQLQLLRIEGPTDLDGAFQAATRGRAGAVILLPHPFFRVHAARVAELALRHRLPTMAEYADQVEAGGLMSYGASGTDLWRRAATYVDKILKGAKPADLPIEQPTKFELVINLKTAKALGLTIPQSVLMRANEVIQ